MAKTLQQIFICTRLFVAKDRSPWSMAKTEGQHVLALPVPPVLPTWTTSLALLIHRSTSGRPEKTNTSKIMFRMRGVVENCNNATVINSIRKTNHTM